ncbi:hypothetical protein N177_1295 [Lutibaculum baratangense AMV1]|uniref:Uncharacterized protein n=1 Tax=Lutibaculum baratangense AMV1 TaxID=631454 RepID=V4RS62_9HYPH|nr:hypothetical protein N177_1295 [Lutibaculum baratangense AMV1]
MRLGGARLGSRVDDLCSCRTWSFARSRADGARGVTLN